MIRTIRETQLEYGDFQTPLVLAERICQKLSQLGVNPNVILEPTCGVGHFIEAAVNKFPTANKIMGVELNSNYLRELTQKPFFQDPRIIINQGNFFTFDWSSLIQSLDGEILILGNLPWVTNSQQGTINSENLPQKKNFQKFNGLDAVTGKSNFDISEWMLIQIVQWVKSRNAYLAMLCKNSVARKLLKYIYSHQINIADCSTYTIDTQKYFNANVEACLWVCRFDSKSKQYFCDVFQDLESSNYFRIGYRNNILVRDTNTFDQLKYLYSPESKLKWRSGIKHDCSKVMEFRRNGNFLVNGLGEIVDIEDNYIYPLIKGSDVAQNRIYTTERYVLVTQKQVGESTESIQNLAPKAWNYLKSHAKYLDNRKSKIYQNNPRFSIFGVGSYSFAPWKIAICGLYKKLEFRLVGKIDEKSVVFDDTIYFLSFAEQQTAFQVLELLNSTLVIDFYSSLIFWDEKRPIKASILNSLNIKKLLDIKLVEDFIV